LAVKKIIDKGLVDSEFRLTRKKKYDSENTGEVKVNNVEPMEVVGAMEAVGAMKVVGNVEDSNSNDSKDGRRSKRSRQFGGKSKSRDKKSFYKRY
jgi:hypothetical protein